MKLKLVESDSPILRKACVNVADIDKEVKPFVPAIQRLMRKKLGIGLAAPQVGINARFFVTGIKRIKVCINPEILKNEESTEYGIEGCLSFGSQRRKVKRWTSILVQYYDLKGYRISKKLEGYEARVFQHELDHLNGICLFEE